MSENLITLAQAVTMTSRYRENRNTILKEEYQGNNLLLTCETFDRQSFDDVLGQDGCVKVRVYFGMDEKLQVKAIIVGVNAMDEDILVTNDEKIVEDGSMCPTMCPPPSPLNQD